MKKIDFDINSYWVIAGTAMVLQGIPTANIESIREMKMQMGREKDLEDVKLIDYMFIKSKE